MSRSFTARGVRALALIALLALLPAAGLQAQEGAAATLQEGVRLLQEGDFEAALERFRASADPRARFFEGAALNRLGRFAEAEESLRSSTYDHADGDFELGWSLLGQGRHQEALDALDGYEAARPGRAKTMEFRGRALFGLERFPEAEAAFEEALRRDPSLAPSVQVYQAALAERQGDAERATRLRQEIARTFGDLARRGPAAAAPGVATPEKPWRLYLSLGGGHNSNVVALPDDFALPTDISGQASSYLETAFDGSYHWFLTEEQDQVYLGYRLLSDGYGGLSDFDLLDHGPYAGARVKLGERVYAGLRVGAQFTQVGGRPLRTAWQVRPSLALRHSDWGALEGAFSLTSSDYFFDVEPVLDRDATSATVSMTEYFAPPGTRLEGRAGWYRTRTEAAGSDFDSTSQGLFLGLSHPLADRLVLDATWQHGTDEYSQLNSLAGPFGFAYPRHDDYDRWSAQLRYQVVEEANLFFRWSRDSNISNIPFYGFARDVWQGGVDFRL